MEMVDQPSFSLYYYSMAFIFTVYGREKTFPKFRSMLQILILANVYVAYLIIKLINSERNNVLCFKPTNHCLDTFG